MDEEVLPPSILRNLATLMPPDDAIRIDDDSEDARVCLHIKDSADATSRSINVIFDCYSFLMIQGLDRDVEAILIVISIRRFLYNELIINY